MLEGHEDEETRACCRPAPYGTVAHAQKGTEVAHAAQLHQEYTDLVITSEKCPGITMDLDRWEKEVRKVAGSSGQGMLKAFDVSEQGGAWREKRYDEFAADLSKQCAAAMDTYGPKAMDLLKRK